MDQKLLASEDGQTLIQKFVDFRDWHTLDVVPVHVSRWKMSPVCDNQITVIINIWWTGNICQQLPGYNDFSTGNIIQMWYGFVIGWHCYKTFHILNGEKIGNGRGVIKTCHS